MIPQPIRRFARGARKNQLAWRYGFNLRPSLNHHLSGNRLGGEAARVLTDLNRDGIAISSVQDLLGLDSCYPELLAATEQLQQQRAQEIADARKIANDDGAIGKKTFMIEYLGRNPTLDPTSAFARLALERPLLGIANAYLRMFTRLRYYNVWHTFATTSKPRESQLWHRDREDLYIMKVFLYLNDVDLGAGPFTYAPGTHRRGPIQQEPEYFLEGKVKRTDDDQMSRVVPRDKLITAVGRKGTIVFADTNGYHRGGLARTSDRIMYTCMYTSQASESEEFFVRPETEFTAGDRAVAFALTR